MAGTRRWDLFHIDLKTFLPIDAATCCIRYSRLSKLGNTGDKGPSPSLNHVSNQKWRLHLEITLDLIAGSPATGKSVEGIINLSVDDLFGTTRFDQT